jgi:hypothetical protein
MRAYKGEGDRFVSAMLQLLLSEFFLLTRWLQHKRSQVHSKFKGLVSPRRAVVGTSMRASQRRRDIDL